MAHGLYQQSTDALETILLKCVFSLKTTRSLETAVSAEAPQCSVRYEEW